MINKNIKKLIFFKYQKNRILFFKKPKNWFKLFFKFGKISLFKSKYYFSFS